MSGISVADDVEMVCTQQISFAGRPILLETNAPRLARYASDFLPEDVQHIGLTDAPAARIRLMVREADEARRDDASKDASWFRARGFFAFARFTQADTFWFNLRTREVFGSFSAHFANDRERWRNHVFPALLGILSPTIDVVPVHAACIAHSAGGVLLAGSSGTGKSTLTVSLAKRGYALLSDEWTYLSRSYDTIEAWSIPVPVKLLPDAGRFFPELASHRTGISLNGELAYEVNPEKCFGLPRRLHSGVNYIVLLERREQKGCRVVRISAKQAMDHLVAEIEPLQGPLAPCYERQIDLIHRLGDAICFRVYFNDHPSVVAKELDHALWNLY